MRLFLASERSELVVKNDSEFGVDQCPLFFDVKFNNEIERRLTQKMLKEHDYKQKPWLRF
jgi:hypothetical protein